MVVENLGLYCHLPITCSCIPFGNVYGRSCLEKWLGACGNTSAKVPYMLLCRRDSCYSSFRIISDCRQSCVHHDNSQLICACQSFFISGVLSAMLDLNRSILSTSTHQEICLMVVPVCRFLFGPFTCHNSELP